MPRIPLVLLALLGLASSAGAGDLDLTLVAVGDVGLNRHRVNVHEDGMDLWGKRVPFDVMTRHIGRYLDGDINFCNLETVVTDRNDLPVTDKTYNFRTHPNAVKVLLKAGFNLFSTANNHVGDYGAEGITETRKWLDAIGRKGRLHHAGAGRDEAEAATPAIFTVKGVRVAFAAVSIGVRATKSRAGVISTHSPDPALKALRDAKADLRILSMHAGTERALVPVAYQKTLARRAISDFGVDVVIGHHPHVVQGIERYGNGLIFYSLGNFALRGARNMGSDKELRGTGDYGLLVRLDLRVNPRKGTVTFRRLEGVPVFDMHEGPHPFRKAADAAARIEVLNRLSKAFSKKDPAVALEEKEGRFVYDFPSTDEP
ncbi:MAG: CapA family protein [Deltaproteobacteria bacterium]|nr:CapA family protein [Deltaproteobacteria bacterium]